MVNPNTRAKSQAMRKIIQGLWFGPWRHVVPGPVRRLGRKGFERLQAMNTETAARPSLDPALAAEVTASFAADVDRLSTLLVVLFLLGRRSAMPTPATHSFTPG